jgi:hypothetical protein
MSFNEVAAAARDLRAAGKDPLGANVIVSGSKPSDHYTDTTPLLHRLIQKKLYVFGTPDPIMLYMGEFVSDDGHGAITVRKAVTVRLVPTQQPGQVEMRVGRPGEDAYKLDVPLYILQKIGLTYAAEPTQQLLEAYQQRVSPLALPKAKFQMPMGR